MSSNPLVSVVIPAYNAQRVIGETLESILAQTYQNLEVVVIDDGSVDATAEIVNCYAERVRYCYQANSGGSAVPRNTGINLSSGAYLCFFDADDIMVPDRIALQVEFMECHPHVGLLFCDYLNFFEEGIAPISHFKTCPRLWSQLRDQKEMVLENACSYLAEENFGITGTFMVRKSMLAIEAGFEPTLKACEDFHFYFRLARHTPVGIINKIGMMRRMHQNNMSGNQFNMLSEGIRCRVMLRDIERDSKIRGQLTGYIAECQGSLARYYADHGQYANAFQEEWQALLSDFCFSRFKSSLKNFTRTLLMVFGLHTPKMN